MKSRIEKGLEKLLTVGDVGVYRTIDGDYGVSLDFYDDSYYLAHPASTLTLAVRDMLNEWRVKAALKQPRANQLAYIRKVERSYIDKEEGKS